MNHSFKNVLLLLAMSLLTSGGCKTVAPSGDLTNLNAILSTIADPDSSLLAFDEAIVNVRKCKVQEKPEFWVAIVNERKPIGYSFNRKRRALIEFFRRHISPGVPLKRFWEIKGLEGWFNEKNVQTAATLSTFPIERPFHQSAWTYEPDLLLEIGAPICFSIDKPIFKSELIDILNHKTEEGGNIKLRQIVFLEPR